MNKNNQEIRAFKGDVGAAEGRVVSGYAVVFDQPSQDMGYLEFIDRGAITQELIDSSDIFMRFDHKDDNFLARSRYGQGTLKLTLDDKGLFYEFEVPDTAFGNDVLSKIQRGECVGSSFAFGVDKTDASAQKWSQDSEGVITRHIYKIAALWDCSVVAEPAYLSTTVQARSLLERRGMLQKTDDAAKELNDLVLDEKLKDFDDDVRSFIID